MGGGGAIPLQALDGVGGTVLGIEGAQAHSIELF